MGMDFLAADREDDILHQVRTALERRSSLEIVGSGSKRFFGRRVRAQPLAVGGHCGIVEYEPTELVITARCGTPLSDIEAELDGHGQMLAFEPPHFGAGATLGGAVACGLSGPRRPFAGSLRDCVLGTKLINGKGEVLSFGGRVMKNVAGFDVSRLMVGALGTLGVLLEVTLKVLPKADEEWTLCFEAEDDVALERMNQWVREGMPLSAAAHVGGITRVRLAGSTASLAAAHARMGGDREPDGAEFWEHLREQKLAFFQGPAPLWRLSVPAAAPRIAALAGDWLLDWAGGQRWLRTQASEEDVFSAAAELGGHASCFRGVTDRAFHPLQPSHVNLQRRIKQSFDPEGVFNRGRLYDEW